MERWALVADDAATFRMSVARWLCRQGYNVVSCESLLEAQDAINVRAPDLAIIDLFFPTPGAGLRLLELIRTVAPSAPLIMCTGLLQGALPPTVNWARRYNALVLSKPVTFEELGQAMALLEGGHGADAVRKARDAARLWNMPL